MDLGTRKVIYENNLWISQILINRKAYRRTVRCQSLLRTCAQRACISTHPLRKIPLQTSQSARFHSKQKKVDFSLYSKYLELSQFPFEAEILQLVYTVFLMPDRKKRSLHCIKIRSMSHLVCGMTERSLSLNSQWLCEVGNHFFLSSINVSCSRYNCWLSSRSSFGI